MSNRDALLSTLEADRKAMDLGQKLMMEAAKQAREKGDLGRMTDLMKFDPKVLLEITEQFAAKAAAEARDIAKKSGNYTLAVYQNAYNAAYQASVQALNATRSIYQNYRAITPTIRNIAPVVPVAVGAAATYTSWLARMGATMRAVGGMAQAVGGAVLQAPFRIFMMGPNFNDGGPT